MHLFRFQTHQPLRATEAWHFSSNCQSKYQNKKMDDPILSSGDAQKLHRSHKRLENPFSPRTSKHHSPPRSLKQIFPIPGTRHAWGRWRGQGQTHITECNGEIWTLWDCSNLSQKLTGSAPEDAKEAYIKPPLLSGMQLPKGKAQNLSPDTYLKFWIAKIIEKTLLKEGMWHVITG